MTDIMQVPANVAAIIAAKKIAMAEEVEERHRKDAVAEAEAEAKAQMLIAEKMREFEENIPQWMLQYECTAEFLRERDAYDLVMIGKNQRTLKSLFFKVPGLSTIEFNFEDDEWRSSSAGWNDEDLETMPYFYFGRDSYWRSSFEFVLVMAEEEVQEYQRLLGVREKILADRARREEEKLQPKSESDVEEKQEKPAPRWAAEAIEGQLLYMCAEGDQKGIAEMQVRATLLVVEQLKRIADFCERNDGSDGILCQIRDWQA